MHVRVTNHEVFIDMILESHYRASFESKQISKFWVRLEKDLSI